jgi:hypothetical protein
MSTYLISNRRTGKEGVVNLQASANVEGGNITDDYLPEETDAEELFLMWAKMMMENTRTGWYPFDGG